MDEYARRMLQDESSTEDNSNTDEGSSTTKLADIIDLDIKNMDTQQSYTIFLESWEPLYLEL